MLHRSIICLDSAPSDDDSAYDHDKPGDDDDDEDGHGYSSTQLDIEHYWTRKATRAGTTVHPLISTTNAVFFLLPAAFHVRSESEWWSTAGLMVTEGILKQSVADNGL